MNDRKRKAFKQFGSSDAAEIIDQEKMSGKRPILFASDLSFSPPTDVWETADKIVVMMEIASLSMNDFSIKYQEGYLIIEGERREPPDVKDSDIIKFHKKEIDYGAFSIKIKMNTRIKSETVSARYHNGMLAIVLPKNVSRLVKKEKKITVKKSKK